MNPDTIFDKIQNKIVDNAMMCRVQEQNLRGTVANIS